MKIDSKDLLANLVEKEWAETEKGEVERRDAHEEEKEKEAAEEEAPTTPTKARHVAGDGAGSPALAGIANMPVRKSAHVTAAASEAAHAFAERILHAHDRLSPAAGPAPPRSPRAVIVATPMSDTDSADDWETVDPSQAAALVEGLSSTDQLARGPGAGEEEEEEDDDEEGGDDASSSASDIGDDDDDDDDDQYEDIDDDDDGEDEEEEADEDETKQARAAAIASLVELLSTTAVDGDEAAASASVADTYPVSPDSRAAMMALCDALTRRATSSGVMMGSEVWSSEGISIKASIGSRKS